MSTDYFQSFFIILVIIYSTKCHKNKNISVLRIEHGLIKLFESFRITQKILKTISNKIKQRHIIPWEDLRCINAAHYMTN